MKIQFEKEVPDSLAAKYINSMVGRFYKILPMWESGDQTVKMYIASLINELSGSVWLIETLRLDSEYMTMISILRWMIELDREDIDDLRREVFHLISICKRISIRYSEAEAVEQK